MKASAIRKRSNKLREIAIKHFTNEDRIECQICGFDYEKIYGQKIGKGYIEIHHLRPIYMYESDDETKIIKEALKNLCPVCANCHRMLHRKKGMTYEEVVFEYNSKKLNK